MELTIWQNNGTGLGGVRKTNFEIRLFREQVPGLVGALSIYYFTIYLSFVLIVFSLL